MPLMEKRGGGSILTLTYLGSERVFPNYNVMGVAKAALEATVRYLAADVGPKNIRVNAVSAGPIKTLAAAGIKGFSNILHVYPERAPLRRNVETAEVAEAAAFLLSDAGKGITGEVLLVDAGFHVDRHVAAGLKTADSTEEALRDRAIVGRAWRVSRGACLRVALAHDLVAIHPAVGFREQRLVAVAVVREHRRARADRERHPAPGLRLEHQARQPPPAAPAACSRPLPTAARQHDDELVAGVAHADVVRPDHRAQHLRDLAQRAVADVMAVACR